jgi:type II secretory pathway pseudopilin PulG
MPAPRSANRAVIFGLLLLVIGIAAITFLARRSATHSREEHPAQLRAALGSLRGAIKVYRGRHSHGPTSLGDLVHDGELRSVPADPLTGSIATWRLMVQEDVRIDDFQTNATPKPHGEGIIDVRSSAPGADAGGKAWSDY